MKQRQTEKQFQAAVVQFAKLRKWKGYHTYDSRKSAAGFPDLCMVRGSRIVFAELKSEAGKKTAAQDVWLLSLFNAASAINTRIHGGVDPGVGVGVSVHLWRPSDWLKIEKALA